MKSFFIIIVYIVVDSFCNLAEECGLQITIKFNKYCRFWYVSMVACYLDEVNCTWHHYSPPPSKNGKAPDTPQTIQYDFWLVNGSPNLSLYNTLLYQFSFDRQNTLELYLVFWLCYVILLPVQIYAVR